MSPQELKTKHTKSRSMGKAGNRRRMSLFHPHPTEESGGFMESEYLQFEEFLIPEFLVLPLCGLDLRVSSLQRVG